MNTFYGHVEGAVTILCFNQSAKETFLGHVGFM